MACITMCDVRFVVCFCIVVRAIEISRQAVVSRSLLVVVGCGGVVLGNVEACFPDGVCGLGSRHTEVVVSWLRFISVPDRLQRMSLRGQRHVRGVGIVLSDQVVLRRLAMKMRRLSVMIYGRRVVARRSLFVAHQFFRSLVVCASVEDDMPGQEDRKLLRCSAASLRDAFVLMVPSPATKRQDHNAGV